MKRCGKTSKNGMIDIVQIQNKDLPNRENAEDEDDELWDTIEGLIDIEHDEVTQLETNAAPASNLLSTVSSQGAPASKPDGESSLNRDLTGDITVALQLRSP